MPVGAPKGNRNAAKVNRLWGETLHRAVVQDNAKRLRAAADALIEKAIEGDVPAIRELGDRIDGKVPQAITGVDGGPLQVENVPWLGDRSLARR